MFRLTQLAEQIYWLEFKERYDLCMHFWRVSEAKECPNEELRKNMNLVDYMEWYAKEYGKGKFTYAGDWAGFNVSRDDLRKVYDDMNLPDHNKYDWFIKGIMKFMDVKCLEKNTAEHYYLIGTQMNDLKTLEHEYAHALFDVNGYYSTMQKACIADLDNAGHLDKIHKNLEKMGYSMNVWRDEVQAYLSTGHTSSAGTSSVLAGFSKKEITQICKPFIEHFEEMIEDVPIFKNRTKQ